MRCACAVVALVLSAMMAPARVAALGQEFVPLDNWSYQALERLEALGLCTLPEDRPFTRTEFVQIVDAVSRSGFDQRLSARGRYNLARLEKEYTEFTSQRDPQYRYDPPTFYLHDAPLTMQGDVDLDASAEESFFAEDTEFYLRSNPTFKVHLNDNVTFDMGYRLTFGPEHGDRIRNRKPSRGEKSFKGLTALYERGYVVAGWDKFHVFAGRDHIDWGPSDWGNLITPGGNISVDQIGARVRIKNLRLSAFHGQLSPLSQRYFAGHRLEIAWRRSVFGINETAVYAGRDFDPVYAVPLGSFYANQFNARDNSDNIMWSVDAKTSFMRMFTVYGSLLIDDAQWERDGVNPDKIAFDVGGRMALSSPVAATVSARYRFVDIYTLTHHDSTAAYVSGEGDLAGGDVLLGASPGPDTETWRIRADVYPRENVVVGLFAYGEGRGAGNDFRPHTAPEDPNPPFPSGYVQRTRGGGADVRWELRRNQFVTGPYTRARIHSAGNILGMDETISAFRVFLHWEFL